MKFDIKQNYKGIVIGGSAGSFQPITKILSKLPSDFPLPIFLCLHRLKHVRNGFVEALSIKSTKKIVEPHNNQKITGDLIYLAPANYHLALEESELISLSTEHLVNNSRPSIDIMFESASYLYQDNLIGILLSGANKDGALGMKYIKQKKGLTIIQDINESMISAMPNSAKMITQIDYELKIDEIIDFLFQLHQNYK
jgi:two-component system chemotaxis response regulator CheB